MSFGTVQEMSQQARLLTLAEAKSIQPNVEEVLSMRGIGGFAGVKREASGPWADGGYNIVIGAGRDGVRVYIKESEAPAEANAAPWGTNIVVTGDICLKGERTPGFLKLMGKKCRALRFSAAGGAGGPAARPAASGGGFGQGQASGGFGGNGGGHRPQAGPAHCGESQDDRSRSIERQVAVKVAGEFLQAIAVAKGLDVGQAIAEFQNELGGLTDVAHAAIRGVAARPAQGPAAEAPWQGGHEGEGPGEDDLPF